MEEDFLTFDEQAAVLNEYLRRSGKMIYPVERDGLCILHSFVVGFNNVGLECSVDGLKELLKSQTYHDAENYKSFSYDTDDVIRELHDFLENPSENYPLNSVDLFFDAICKGMATKATIYQIDSYGKVTELESGLMEGHTCELSFARYGILHVDPVLKIGPYQDDTIFVDGNDPTNAVPDDGYHDDIILVDEMSNDSINAAPDDGPDEIDYNNLSTQQLLTIILINPEKYLVEKPLKAVRRNLIYTVRNASANEINCDDNGSYSGFGSTRKTYHVTRDEHGVTSVSTVHKRNEDYFRKERSGNQYIDVLTPRDEVFTVERAYRYNKSIPGLKHLKVRIKSATRSQYNDCTCVVYYIKNDEKPTKNVNEIKLENDEVFEVQILPHGNTKHHDKPYIRTSKTVLEQEDLLLRSSNATSNVYDQVLKNSGGPYFSSSQSQEPRDLQQVYRRKSLAKKNDQPATPISAPSEYDEITKILHAQKSSKLIHSVVVLADKYLIVLKDDRQVHDISQFCTSENASVLGVDTTYNLCDLWMTDTCYRNKRLINPKTQNHPVFLGPMMFHFSKDEETFMRFALELFASNKEISKLKCIGVDLESAIFNGFKNVFPGLDGLICVWHIGGRDGVKIDKLQASSKGDKNENGRSKSEILHDIYGEKNGASYDMGLAEAYDPDDFISKLNSLREKWESLCPGFYSWFERKRKDTFCSSVIQSARDGTDIVGLFYQNDVESMHHAEKLKQCFQKKSLLEVIQSLEAMVTRQDEQEVLAIYGSGSYVLAEPYKWRFGRDSAVWHSWSAERRQQHVKAMREFKPTISNLFHKPANCGRKPGQQVRVRKRLTPDVITDRFEGVLPPKVASQDQDMSTNEASTSSNTQNSAVSSVTSKPKSTASTSSNTKTSAVSTSSNPKSTASTSSNPKNSAVSMISKPKGKAATSTKRGAKSNSQQPKRVAATNVIPTSANNAQVVTSDGNANSAADDSASSTNIPVSLEEAERLRFADPRERPDEIFEVHFRKNLPRAIAKCRGACGVKITPNDPGLLMHSYGVTRWTNKTTGVEESRHGPMYIHFQEECLKQFDSATHYRSNQNFDYSKLTIDKKQQSQLNIRERSLLVSLGVRLL